MWDWLKRKRPPDPPAVEQITIGQLHVPSGVLLLADPMYMHNPVKIEGVPQGRFDVRAQLIRYPEGGEQVAKVGMAFRPEAPQKREAAGTIDVDSATVVVVDADVYRQHWKEVGPERIGRVGIAGHRKVARLIAEKFGLKFRHVNPITWDFEEPVSGELEARIHEYLQTLPDYADCAFMCFSVTTMNTFDRIQDAMQGRVWAEIIVDESSGANLLAFSSGYGDGGYSVERLHGLQALVGVEVEFIGPTQEKILEAFPILQY